MTDAIEKLRKRLLYLASYRGFKEADLLIGGFAKAHLPEMSENELAEFETLLQINDRELYAYATGNVLVPAEIDGVVMTKLKAFKLAAV
ncbi:succinate dehydrogenase assembly factor 2 [Hyphococcus flavus]|uniref:FAD assembly factor SdhE n=1 Tax=Hyphococcus flavus TaxID=1866326 RepID=A0AAE9ZHR4_9PROT|nr:succinate dehydrogenase assembly factor 2 [Hyphococcus flavus]WDI31086.1 succinate dehydrogenase assembly factor 2 [Hyphococcus flavus]